MLAISPKLDMVNAPCITLTMFSHKLGVKLNYVISKHEKIDEKLHHKQKYYTSYTRP